MKNDGTDTTGGGDDVELLRKESAGKDRRITELYARIKELETERETEALNGADAETMRRRLLEISATLKSREAELADKERALKLAVEKNVAPELMLRGAGDLDNYIQELAGFEKQIRESVGWRQGVQDDKSPPDISKMNPREIARIPDDILDALQGIK